MNESKDNNENSPLSTFLSRNNENYSLAGVQKPGGDAGIDPNALKSLVG